MRRLWNTTSRRIGSSLAVVVLTMLGLVAPAAAAGYVGMLRDTHAPLWTVPFLPPEGRDEAALGSAREADPTNTLAQGIGRDDERVMRERLRAGRRRGRGLRRRRAGGPRHRRWYGRDGPRFGRLVPCLGGSLGRDAFAIRGRAGRFDARGRRGHLRPGAGLRARRKPAGSGSRG